MLNLLETGPVLVKLLDLPLSGCGFILSALLESLSGTFFELFLPVGLIDSAIMCLGFSEVT